MTRSILVVRLDFIGDFILWVNYARQIRSHYNRLGYRVILFGNDTWSVLADSEQVCDEFVSVNTKKLLLSPTYRYRILRSAYRQSASLAIQPALSRKLPLGDSIIRFSRARERIGCRADVHAQSLLFRAISDHWYTNLISFDYKEMHELQINHHITEILLKEPISFSLPTLFANKMVPPDICLPDNYYVIAPGASWGGRLWPIECFIDIANKIWEQFGWTCIVCGGQNDRTLGDTLATNLGTSVIDLTGKTSLMQLEYVIKGARLLLSNESGTVHLAAALGVQSICLLGGGHFGRFVPYPDLQGKMQTSPIAVFKWMDCYGCGWICRKPHLVDGPVPCIMEITTEQVWSVIKKYAHSSHIVEA